ncbi:TonB-dependent receptor plug domain-containing protein [Xanthomonas hyacinthi]|uniref:TonB-dependent receptor plug domain-containing protein n=1 Tax=Xanthomonas hyacinthi TaxID=56455 RepID=UPI00069EF55A|nr:Plug domain-containing protein [Xanthomonas hyacinthi]
MPATRRQRPSLLPLALAATLCAPAHAAEPAAAAAERKTTDLDAIRVSAERVDVPAGALGERPARDTPFSITRIDAEDLQARQVNSLAQMFMTDPSVSGNVGAYNSSWYTTIQVRGLPVSYSNGYKLNGMPLYTMAPNGRRKPCNRCNCSRVPAASCTASARPAGSSTTSPRSPPTRRCWT